MTVRLNILKLALKCNGKALNENVFLEIFTCCRCFAPGVIQLNRLTGLISMCL